MRPQGRPKIERGLRVEGDQEHPGPQRQALKYKDPVDGDLKTPSAQDLFAPAGRTVLAPARLYMSLFLS